LKNRTIGLQERNKKLRKLAARVTFSMWCRRCSELFWPCGTIAAGEEEEEGERRRVLGES
jgi:hypothetical protein